MKQGLCNLVYSETGPLRKKQKLYNFHNNSILCNIHCDHEQKEQNIKYRYSLQIALSQFYRTVL